MTPDPVTPPSEINHLAQGVRSASSYMKDVDARYGAQQMAVGMAAGALVAYAAAPLFVGMEVMDVVMLTTLVMAHDYDMRRRTGESVSDAGLNSVADAVGVNGVKGGLTGSDVTGRPVSDFWRGFGLTTGVAQLYGIAKLGKGIFDRAFNSKPNTVVPGQNCDPGKPSAVHRVYEKPKFQLRSGEEGLSVFDADVVSAEDVLPHFRQGSRITTQQRQLIESHGLKIIQTPGNENLPPLLRDNHWEIRPGDAMIDTPGGQSIRSQFKAALKKLSAEVENQ